MAPMSISRGFRVAVLALALFTLPSALDGQAGPAAQAVCDTYEGCALRLKYGLITTRIVRGADDAQVARLTFRPPPLEELFARSDPASASFQRFRTAHLRSSWMGLMGGIGFVGGLVAGAAGHHGWAAGLSIGGSVFSVGAGAFRTRANEHLSRAVWWHNASLAGEATPAHLGPGSP